MPEFEDFHGFYRAIRENNNRYELHSFHHFDEILMLTPLEFYTYRRRELFPGALDMDEISVVNVSALSVIQSAQIEAVTTFRYDGVPIPSWDLEGLEDEDEEEVVRRPDTHIHISTSPGLVTDRVADAIRSMSHPTRDRDRGTRGVWQAYYDRAQTPTQTTHDEIRAAWERTSDNVYRLPTTITYPTLETEYTPTISNTIDTIHYDPEVWVEGDMIVSADSAAPLDPPEEESTDNDPF